MPWDDFMESVGLIPLHRAIDANSMLEMYCMGIMQQTYLQAIYDMNMPRGDNLDTDTV